MTKSLRQATRQSGPKSKFRHARHLFLPHRGLIIGVAVIFAIAGYALVSSSRAATYAVNAQAESATITGNASKVSDTTASSSSAVKFGGTAASALDLSDPVKKEIAQELVSSAENSTLNWKGQYKYIEDIGDGRGYTAGIIGFCSGCGDMYDLVNYYNGLKPSNVLTKYTATLKSLGDSESASHTGLDPNFVTDWGTAAKDTVFQQSQNHMNDLEYFNPAMTQAKADSIGILGQFIYYDAYVMHGGNPDDKVNCATYTSTGKAPANLSFQGIRLLALCKAKPPSQGGDQTAYLNAFLDARVAEMVTEAAHDDVDRVNTEQRVFLKAGNLNLDPPLTWTVYGDPYSIKTNPTP